MQGALTTLALPPMLLAVCALVAGLLAWRGPRGAALVAAAAAALQLAMATPLAEGLLVTSLQRAVPAPDAAVPGAIVVLSAEAVHTESGLDVGPLTLERLRAGAALHRSTGLPLLLTGGAPSAGAASLADIMATSARADFRVEPRWLEPAARDTRENAAFSAAILRAEGIGAVHLVTHAWHLPRAAAAFAREGLAVTPAPVRLETPPDGRLSDLLPRADHLAGSWWALREWAGRVVYRLRDGEAAPPRAVTQVAAQPARH